VAQRQAWCPRCDEVRRARPGRQCPTCGSTLLDVPGQGGARRPPPARLGLRAAVGQARGRLLPAVRVGLAGLAAVALVAGTFLAGRATRAGRTAAPPATTTTSTSTGAGGFGGEDERQFYGWSSRTVGGIELNLRSIEAGDRATTLTLEAVGVPDGRSIATFLGLGVTDAAGHQLLRSAPIPEVPARGRAFGGEQVAQVTVDDPLADKAAVSRVQVEAVTLVSQVSEEVAVTVFDPRLRRQPFRERDPCPGCRLDAHCTSCATMAVAGSAYRQGEVVLLLLPKGPLDRSVLGTGAPDVLVSDAMFGSEAQPAVDRTPGGATAVQFATSDFALGSRGARVAVQVTVSAELLQTVHGPWAMRQP
jgi:hypothetical protein